MSIEDDRARYERAAHAMQSGVAAEMGFHEAHGGTSSATSPKHLRTGVNVAMRDHSSIVSLLIRKGILTDEEVMAALADGMEEEVRLHERLVSDLYGGAKITLG